MKSEIYSVDYEVKGFCYFSVDLALHALDPVLQLLELVVDVPEVLVDGLYVGCHVSWARTLEACRVN